MIKAYCILYREKVKRIWTNKWLHKYDIMYAHKHDSAIKEFEKRHPFVIIEGVFIEYKKRK